MHGQCPPPVRGPKARPNAQEGGWHWGRIGNKGDRHVSPTHSRRQLKNAHNLNPKQPLLTWFETVPPVAPTLGAEGEGNGKQGQDMDGKLLGQMCPVLEGRKILQIDSLQRIHQYTNILLRALFQGLSSLHDHLRGLRGSILLPRARPANTWLEGDVRAGGVHCRREHSLAKRAKTEGG
jgi:hypothetical protein